MVPEVIIAALLLGWALNGRLVRLADAEIRFGWLIFVSLALSMAARTAIYSHSVPFSAPLYATVKTAELAIFITLAFANWNIPGAWMFLLGSVANLVAIVANHGIMPLSYKALVVISGGGNLDKGLAMFPFVKSILIDSGTRLVMLCDVLPVRWPYGLVASVYSIGDVVTSVGGLLAIVALMRNPQSARRAKAPQEA